MWQHSSVRQIGGTMSLRGISDDSVVAPVAIPQVPQLGGRSRRTWAIPVIALAIGAVVLLAFALFKGGATESAYPDAPGIGIPTAVCATEEFVVWALPNGSHIETAIPVEETTEDISWESPDAPGAWLSTSQKQLSGLSKCQI